MHDKIIMALLEFIQRVRLTDLGAFSYYSLLHNQNTLMSNEDFLWRALIDSKSNFNKSDESAKFDRHVQKQFPSGKYHF